MKIKEYLINLLNKIKYDENGQWGSTPVWQQYQSLAKPGTYKAPTKYTTPVWQQYQQLAKPGTYTTPKQKIGRAHV